MHRLAHRQAAVLKQNGVRIDAAAHNRAARYRKFIRAVNMTRCYLTTGNRKHRLTSLA